MSPATQAHSLGEAWALLYGTRPQAPGILTRTQVAALLGVSPSSVLLYEQSGKLTKANGPREWPALIDVQDFGPALRFLITKGLLKKAADLGREAKRGPAPKNQPPHGL